MLPLAVAAGAIPIIAFAPLFNTWFGLLNPLSKMMMAAVLSFFPVMANVTRGLSGVDPSSLELMRSYAASEGAILRKVRVPNALPYFFTALKLASTLSLIGAIVAEYFGGQRSVLGRMIVQSSSALQVRHHLGRGVAGGGRGDRLLPGDRSHRAARDPLAQLDAQRGLTHPQRRAASPNRPSVSTEAVSHAAADSVSFRRPAAQPRWRRGRPAASGRPE